MNVNIEVFLHPHVLIGGFCFLAFVGVLVCAFFYMKCVDNKEKPMSNNRFIRFLIKVFGMFLHSDFY